MSVRISPEGRCSWCGGDTHGEWCPHDHLANAPTTAAQRVLVEKLCVLDNTAMRYGKKLKDMPEASSLANKLGVKL